MVQADLYKHLPTSDDLPDSDDTPVDNEDQNLLPNYLLFLLKLIWADRQDWYFGVDMGIYHTTGGDCRIPVIPDGFLALGVPRRKPGQRFRRSYVLWEEADTVPTMTLEMVSWSPGGEYVEKMAIYANLGVLYYVIYNPEYWGRDKHQPFEVYKLIDGEYQLQRGEPYWMPEAGLAIGRAQGLLGGEIREVLTWFDAEGNRYPSAEEKALDLEAQAQAYQTQVQEYQTQAQRERQARLAAIEPLHQRGLSAEDIADILSLPVDVVEQAIRQGA